MRRLSSRGSNPPSTIISFGSDGSSLELSSNHDSFITFSGKSIRAEMLTPSDVSVSNRPVTGAGGLARRQRIPGSTPTRDFESVGYYTNLLQSKTDQIMKEISRLRSELETVDSGSDSRQNLENNCDDLRKCVQQLESDLADYNLAKVKARAGANHEDVRHELTIIAKNNKGLEQEVDMIFMSRKRMEDEILKTESGLKNVYSVIEKRIRSSSPEKMIKFQSLLEEIDMIRNEKKDQEQSIVLLRNKLKSIEELRPQSRYKEAIMRLEELNRRIEETEDDLKIATLDEDEARDALLNKVNLIQENTKQIEDKSSILKSEIEYLLQVQRELRAELRVKSNSRSKDELTTFENLFRKDEEIRKFLINVPAVILKTEEENNKVASAIEALREDIEKRSNMTDMKLPSKNELDVIKDEVVFTTRHLENTHETISLLQQQKKTRMEELDRIDSLEERISVELKDLESRMASMCSEMEKFQNLSDLKDSGDATRNFLVEISEKYNLRLKVLDQLLKGLSSHYESKVRILESSPTWQNVEDLRGKVRDQEQNIFRLQQVVSEMKTKTDYSSMKAISLELVNKINRCYMIDKQ